MVQMEISLLVETLSPRLSEIAEQGMLDGIEKDAVDMILNFSEDEEWPKVLPAVFPRLLVNGAQGIGVGIST